MAVFYPYYDSHPASNPPLGLASSLCLYRCYRCRFIAGLLCPLVRRFGLGFVLSLFPRVLPGWQLFVSTPWYHIVSPSSTKTVFPPTPTLAHFPFLPSLFNECIHHFHLYEHTTTLVVCRRFCSFFVVLIWVHCFASPPASIHR